MNKYTGSVTTTGKSEAIRFEKGLFRQNPEFKQQAKVEAHIIGPGRMLVSIVNDLDPSDNEDPIVMAFMSFLERDMSENPNRITPVSGDAVARAVALTKDIVVREDEIIDDDVSL